MTTRMRHAPVSLTVASPGDGTVQIPEPRCANTADGRGSELAFEDAGLRELKGVPGRWQLYRVVK